MNRTKTALSLLTAIALVSAHPVLAADGTAIKNYADVFAITAIAEAKCPGVRANDAVVARFKRTMKVTDADKPELDAEADAYTKKMAHMVVEIGMCVWCDKAWDLLGPQGTMMKNALKRANF